MPKIWQLTGLLPVLAFAAGTLYAQAPAAAPQFEVASIKQAPPLDPQKIMAGQMHIGVTIDAGRVDIGNLSLADLIRIAYKIKSYQLIGPDWMPAQRFDVQAKIPEGGTKEQVPEMLQALLAERFKLEIHRGTKEESVYALVVGKNGPKMKEAVEDPSAAANPSGSENQVRVKPNTDGKGVTVAGAGVGQVKMAMAEGGTMRMEFGKMPMAGLAEMVTRFVDRPVVDMTDLKGNYQVSLELSMEEIRNMARSSAMAAGMALPMGLMGGGGGDANRAPADAAGSSGSSIFAAVQQLGLKLESRKQPVETIVIDHLEKSPTEN